MPSDRPSNSMGNHTSNRIGAHVSRDLKLGGLGIRDAASTRAYFTGIRVRTLGDEAHVTFTFYSIDEEETRRADAQTILAASGYLVERIQSPVPCTHLSGKEHPTPSLRVRRPTVPTVTSPEDIAAIIANHRFFDISQPMQSTFLVSKKGRRRPQYIIKRTGKGAAARWKVDVAQYTVGPAIRNMRTLQDTLDALQAYIEKVNT